MVCFFLAWKLCKDYTINKDKVVDLKLCVNYNVVDRLVLETTLELCDD
jgi:hypothetical protein